VCVSVFLSVCYYCFFSDCRIYLFSSLAARVFNKLTRYSLRSCSQLIFAFWTSFLNCLALEIDQLVPGHGCVYILDYIAVDERDRLT